MFFRHALWNVLANVDILSQEQMMRKKQAMHLDARYVTMVENAYYYCNPPPAEKTVRRKRPPLQEYVRKLLYKDLSKVTTEKVKSESSSSHDHLEGCAGAAPGTPGRVGADLRSIRNDFVQVLLRRHSWAGCCRILEIRILYFLLLFIIMMFHFKF